MIELEIPPNIVQGWHRKTWHVVASASSFTVQELATLQNDYETPLELDLEHYGYDGEVIEVGYWVEPSEREVLRREAEWLSAVRRQNDEYRRMGLL